MQLWLELVIGLAHGLQVGAFAQGFCLDHVVHHRVHAEDGRETLELVQQAVGARQIAGIEQGTDLWQIILQGLLQGFEQGQHALHVTHIFHGAVNAQTGVDGMGHGVQ